MSEHHPGRVCPRCAGSGVVPGEPTELAPDPVALCPVCQGRRLVGRLVVCPACRGTFDAGDAARDALVMCPDPACEQWFNLRTVEAT